MAKALGRWAVSISLRTSRASNSPTVSKALATVRTFWKFAGSPNRSQSLLQYSSDSSSILPGGSTSRPWIPRGFPAGSTPHPLTICPIVPDRRRPMIFRFGHQRSEYSRQRGHKRLFRQDRRVVRLCHPSRMATHHFTRHDCNPDERRTDQDVRRGVACLVHRSPTSAGPAK
jgi:hypothetical protein